jgi:hypothetical protein
MLLFLGKLLGSKGAGFGRRFLLKEDSDFVLLESGDKIKLER